MYPLRPDWRRCCWGGRRRHGRGRAGDVGDGGGGAIHADEAGDPVRGGAPSERARPRVDPAAAAGAAHAAGGVVRVPAGVRAGTARATR